MAYHFAIAKILKCRDGERRWGVKTGSVFFSDLEKHVFSIMKNDNFFQIQRILFYHSTNETVSLFAINIYNWILGEGHT